MGSQGDIQFGNEWSTRRLDVWLQEILLAAFEHNCVPEEDYVWWLLKSHHSHLSFYREFLDGVDLISAKGGKGKGWQDSKIYFGKLTFHIIGTVWELDFWVVIPPVFH